MILVPEIVIGSNWDFGLGMGNLNLEMDNNITWENIPTKEQTKIKNALQQQV